MRRFWPFILLFAFAAIIFSCGYFVYTGKHIAAIGCGIPLLVIALLIYLNFKRRRRFEVHYRSVQQYSWGSASVRKGIVRRKKRVKGKGGVEAESSDPYFPLANTPPHYDDIEHSVQAEFNRLNTGSLIFQAPEKMTVGKTEIVEARIARHAKESLAEALRGLAIPQVEEIKVGAFMKIKLQGEYFRIGGVGEEDQFVPEDGFAAWKWQVTPLEAGIHTLFLVATVSIKIAGVEAPHTVRVKEKKIEVAVDATHAVKPTPDPMPPTSSHIKQQTIFSWVFGTLFFFVLTYLLLRKDPIPTDRQGLMTFFCALMGALFAFFFTGKITTNLQMKEWGKVAISATGGFSMFVLIFFGLPKISTSAFQQNPTAPPPKGQVEQPAAQATLKAINLEVDGFVLHGVEGLPDHAEFPLTNHIAINAAADWLDTVIRKRSAQASGDITYTIDYRPDEYTNQTVMKEVRVKVWGGTVKTKVAEKKKIFAFPRSIEITPDDGKLSVYPWIPDSNYQRKDHVPMEVAIEYFKSVRKPIYLQLVRAGYRSGLVKIDPDVALKTDITLTKRDYAVLVRYVEAADIKGEFMSKLTGKEGYRIFGEERADDLRQFLDSGHNIGTDEGANAKLAGIRAREIDYVIDVRVASALDRKGESQAEFLLPIRSNQLLAQTPEAGK